MEAAARAPRIGVVSADDVPLTDVSLVSMIPVPALPLVHAADGPFTIVAKGGESESSWYGLVKIVNLVVLVASLAMCAWLTLRVTSG